MYEVALKCQIKCANYTRIHTAVSRRRKLKYIPLSFDVRWPRYLLFTLISWDCDAEYCSFYGHLVSTDYAVPKESRSSRRAQLQCERILGHQGEVPPSWVSLYWKVPQWNMFQVSPAVHSEGETVALTSHGRNDAILR